MAESKRREAESKAELAAGRLCDQLEPVLMRMIRDLGVELGLCILRGLCDRIEARARAGKVWSDARYAEMRKLSAQAEQSVREEA